MPQLIVNGKALIMYTQGDVDYVKVLSIIGDGSSINDTAVVELPNGSICVSLQENLIYVCDHDPKHDIVEDEDGWIVTCDPTLKENI